MIIVTGTKRSGTSMWMQILGAAGLPAFGEAFPRRWGETLREANPDGFYESILRQGVYWRTNPHPRTGAYFFPEQVERHVVKVFIPGLVRTDRAFIGRVIASVREWREYESSMQRLHALEDRSRTQDEERRPRIRMPPVLEWWHENFALVRDIVTRRYPVHVQSYDGLLGDPEGVVADVLQWLGDGEVDVEAAVAAVKPQNRTQTSPISGTLEPELAEVFDLFYRTLHERLPLNTAFIEMLNETNRVLAPRIAEAQRAVLRDQRQRQLRAQKAALAASEDELDPELPSW
jgi:hypothetical protein